MSVADMKITALASWFGSDRMVAKTAAARLDGCAHVAIPFGGGISIVRYLSARTVNVNDLHRAMMNMASVAKHPTLGPQMYRQLRRCVFHPDELKAAQRRCGTRDSQRDIADGIFGNAAILDNDDQPDLKWAIDYFIVAWMSRHGSAGTAGEFKAPISYRWDAEGGGSAVHFVNAVKSLAAWRRVLRKCDFAAMDFRPFLAKCKDQAGCGIYSDAPWPDEGDGYKNTFTPSDHRDLARLLAGFTAARVVIRFGNHPLIRELYPADRWNWIKGSGRTQTNEDSDEVLLINGPSFKVNAPGGKDA